MSAPGRVERRFHALPVVRAQDETPRLRAIVLDGSQGDVPVAAAYRMPGQWVVARAGGGQAYLALTDAPGGPELSLLVNEAGPVAKAVRELRRGDRLEVSAVEGAGFALEETEGRPLLLLAARTGIAPIRAVIREHLLRPGRWPRLTLMWGAQSMEEFPYRREWPEWEAGGVEIVHVLSRPAAGEDGREHGRVQDVLARRGKAVLGGTASAVSALVVGMPEMVRDCREALDRLGVAPARVLTNF